MDYTQKYLKYKQKYMALKQYAIQRGGIERFNFLNHLNNRGRPIPVVQQPQIPVDIDMYEARNRYINEQKNKLQEEINHLLEQGVVMPDNDVAQLIFLKNQLEILQNMPVGNMEPEDLVVLIGETRQKINELEDRGLVVPQDPRVKELLLLMQRKRMLDNGIFFNNVMA